MLHPAAYYQQAATNHSSYRTTVWFSESGDDSIYSDLILSLFLVFSTRSRPWWGLAVIFNTFPLGYWLLCLLQTHCWNLSLSLCFHTTKTVHFFVTSCPSSKNNFTHTMFYSDFHDLLDCINTLPGIPVVFGDINICYDQLPVLFWLFCRVADSCAELDSVALLHIINWDYTPPLIFT